MLVKYLIIGESVAARLLKKVYDWSLAAEARPSKYSYKD